MISRQRMRQLRNDVPVDRVLDSLGIPIKIRDGYLRFLCPLCREFNTATNPKTNLARCFRCRQNYNPIDLVLVVERVSFLEAVDVVSKLLESR